jgi:hypothetical protein
VFFTFSGNIYEVVDVPFINLVTTSGQLNVNNINDTVNIIINNYINRKCDWIIALNGIILAIIHTNNTVSYV